MGFLELLTLLSGQNLVLLGLLGGLFGALLNTAGAVPILFLKSPPRVYLDVGLGFAAGVMLAASFTSLIIPGIELGGAFPVLVGIALGSITITLLDRLLPHIHAIKGREGPGLRLRAIWLFVLAVTIHNLPEGLAVGVGFGSGNLVLAIGLMLAIAFQNIPEGLSVGFSLLSTESYNRTRAFLVSVASGLVEPPLALIGAWTVSVAHQLLPYAMGFAAGAMIFVVSDEVIPETHRLGHERRASYGLLAGLIIMLALDVLLG